MNITILTLDDLISAGCFDVGNALKIVEESFKKYARGQIILPNKLSTIFDESTQNRINCLPAGIIDEQIYGIKWVSIFPNNPHQKNISNLTAVILLSDTETGFPVAFMEGSLVSNLRTACVGAIAAKYLARKNSEIIGFIGAGEQAKSHLLTMKKVLPSLKICKVSSRTRKSESIFAEQMKKFCPDIDIIPCDGNYKNAVENADVIITAISGQEKILQADWIKNGSFYCHVAGLEDDFSVPLKANKIVCDNWEFVKHRSQTISIMYRSGLLSDSRIYADLHEIITGLKLGRQNDNEFIYFNSVGMAFADIALANWMYKKASHAKIGSSVNLKNRSMFDFELSKE